MPIEAGFETLTRLQWHTNGVHPPGSQHSSSLGLLPRNGGSYVVYDPETRAVHLFGLARFPVSGGNKPSSTYAEACTIFLTMFHTNRVLHPGHAYSTLTDSLSSVHGWDKSALPTTARASLSDKFSPIWLAVRTIVGRGDGLGHPGPSRTDGDEIYVMARFLPPPTPIAEPVLAAHPNLTSRRRHPSRRPIPQRRPCSRSTQRPWTHPRQ